MKVIIIGTNGFIGENLFHFIKKKGFEVEGFSSSEPGNIDPKTGILSDEFRIPEGTNAVIYLAQSPCYHQVPEMFPHVINVNVASAVKLVELARRAEVERFIYTSTGNVYAPSFEPLTENSPIRRDDWYSLSKVHAEEALSLFRNYMNITVIRPFGIYGPGQKDKLIPNLCRSILQGQKIYIEKNPNDEKDLGGLRLSLCYIYDAVKIVADLLVLQGPPIMNVAGDRAISIREIALQVSQFLQKKVSFEILDKAREKDLIADISLLKRFVPPQFTPIEEGLRKTSEHFLRERDSLKS
jgi:UDP-glucose 4-epimerase